MAVTWNPLKEGSSIAAGTLNTEFQNVRTELNDLDTTAIQMDSLHSEHLPSIVIDTEKVSLTATHAYLDSVLACVYPSFVTINSNGSSLGGTELSVTLGSGTDGVDLTDSRVQGILVLLNVHVKLLGEASSGAALSNSDLLVHTRITVGHGATPTYTAIARTRRYVDGDTEVATSGPAGNKDRVYKDMATRAFILPAELPSGQDQVRVIRAEVAVSDLSGSHASLGRVVTATLQHCNLTALVIQSE